MRTKNLLEVRLLNRKVLEYNFELEKKSRGANFEINGGQSEPQGRNHPFRKLPPEDTPSDF